MSTDNGNGTPPPTAPGGADGKQTPQFTVMAQFIKDLSFENPNAPKTLQGPGENPNMQISVNVNAKKVADDTYEVDLDFEAHAKNDAGVIYNLELVYAGLFKLANLPQEALQPVLFIDCPALIFPFVRRLVADLTQEGGFPPMAIDPINFAALYQQNIKKQGVANMAGNTPAAS